MFWLSTQCAAAVCDNWTKELFKFLLCAWNWKGYIWVSVFFWQLVSLRICFLIWQDMKKYSIQGCAKGSKCVNSTNCWLLFTLCFQRRLFYKLQCWFRLMQGSYFEHTHTQTHAHIHTHIHTHIHAQTHFAWSRFCAEFLGKSTYWRWYGKCFEMRFVSYSYILITELL